MKKVSLTLFAFVTATNLAFSQGTAINSSGLPADSSALLDLSSTSQGILIPRMNEAQKNSISSPAEGLMIYQTDGTKGFWYYNGTSWAQAMGASGSSGGKQIFTTNGTFVVPAGVTTVWVSMSGGGGGGGGSSTYGGGGGGGGAAAFASYPLTVTPLSSHSVTIGNGGNGGAGGNSGTSGIASSFGTLLTTNGGFGGTAGLGASGGYGGNPGGAGGSSGSGGERGISSPAYYALGGPGGGSIFGSGGNCSYTQHGTAGSGYGGGGSGGAAGGGGGPSNGNYMGGNGAPGFVLVEW